MSVDFLYLVNVKDDSVAMVCFEPKDIVIYIYLIYLNYINFLFLIFYLKLFFIFKNYFYIFKNYFLYLYFFI